MQAEITKLRFTAKNNKKLAKETNAKIAQLEKELSEKHAAELSQVGQGDSTAPTANVPEKQEQEATVVKVKVSKAQQRRVCLSFLTNLFDRMPKKRLPAP